MKGSGGRNNGTFELRFDLIDKALVDFAKSQQEAVCCNVCSMTPKREESQLKKLGKIWVCEACAEAYLSA